MAEKTEKGKRKKYMYILRERENAYELCVGDGRRRVKIKEEER